MKRHIFWTLYILITAGCTASAAFEQTHLVRIQGDEYTVLENVRLIRDPKRHNHIDPGITEPAPTPQAIGKDRIATFGNMILVPKNTISAQASERNGNRTRKQFFVQNRNTSRVYIVNGELFAQVQNKETAQSIAKDYAITFVLFLAHSKKALFQIPVNDQLFTTTNRMENDQRMQQVTLRLIDNVPTPD